MRTARHSIYSRSFAFIRGYLPLCLALLVPLVRSQAQSGTQSVVAASALHELPLKAWGTYARTHLGPCCLVNQALGQQFVFPIVISQQRESVVSQRVAMPDGRIQTRLTPVVVQRRALGLSPVQAAADDRAPSGPLASLNRRARIVEADGDGLLWTTHIVFAPAALTQPALAGNAGTGNWSEGEATVDCFPAFADPVGDGLLIRVTLTNRSQEKQTYGVDLLGGMDAPGSTFAPEDLFVQAPAGVDSPTIQHGKCQAVFALAGPGAPYRGHAYRVSDAYFAPAGVLARRDLSGAVLPAGLLPPTNPGDVPESENEADKKDSTRAKKRKQGRGKAEVLPNDTPAPPLEVKPNDARSDGDGVYALTRADSVAVLPGQSLTLMFSVGVGKDGEGARDSARALLDIAKAKNGGNGLENAYADARKAHESAQFHSGLPALDRLMSQSLANVPNEERRVGVGTRQSPVRRLGGQYEPARDAFMTLGWMGYRPYFAAAQVNAWFQTTNTPDEVSGVPLRNPRAVPPTNLFALWELYQRTHDRPLLKRYYPFARRRYQELLTAGRIKADGWLFAWPQTVQDAIFVPGSVPVGGAASGDPMAFFAKAGDEMNPVAAPDYAAYVICSAHILQAIAELTDQSFEEKRQYALDALQTTRALNAALWEAGQKTYLPRPQGTAPARVVRADTLAGLLPLMAGAEALAPEQRAALLQNLTDPNTFWSPAGLRSVSKASPMYRPDDGANGAVRFGLNWLFWKALLDAGDMETAHKLAAALLQGYVKAQAASGVCPEWLNGDTGAGAGATDYAGDACALTMLWAAYHQPGVISDGWNAVLLDSGYDRQHDTLHLVVKRLQATGKVVLQGVVGKPNARYALTGAISGIQTTDADGILTLILPQDNSTLVIDAQPTN